MVTMKSEPLFLKNKKWYITPEDIGLDDMFFEDGRGYHIKDSAPQKVKDSYEEFYNDGEPIKLDRMELQSDEWKMV